MVSNGIIISNDKLMVLLSVEIPIGMYESLTINDTSHCTITNHSETKIQLV